MEVTSGGVDIVLNSLTGRFIAQSLKCLRPFGRFIEIGKADIYRNGKLNLEPLFGERMPLDRFSDAFKLLQAGRAEKVLLYPNGLAR